MRILGVLFDLNGVLIDSLDLHAQAWSKGLTINDHPIEKEELRGNRYFGKYGGTELVKLLNRDISDDLAQKYPVPAPVPVSVVGVPFRNFTLYSDFEVCSVDSWVTPDQVMCPICESLAISIN